MSGPNQRRAEASLFEPTGCRLILLRGCPGSGKSTLARSFGGAIFSPDDYFMRGDKFFFNPAFLREAHEWHRDHVQQAMRNRERVIIIDDCNLVAWEMKPFVEMALYAAYAIEIRECDTPWAADAEELARRTRSGLPPDKMLGMLARFERPMNLLRILQSEPPFASLAEFEALQKGPRPPPPLPRKPQNDRTPDGPGSRHVRPPSPRGHHLQPPPPWIADHPRWNGEPERGPPAGPAMHDLSPHHPEGPGGRGGEYRGQDSMRHGDGDRRDEGRRGWAGPDERARGESMRAPPPLPPPFAGPPPTHHPHAHTQQQHQPHNSGFRPTPYLPTPYLPIDPESIPVPGGPPFGVPPAPYLAPPPQPTPQHAPPHPHQPPYYPPSHHPLNHPPHHDVSHHQHDHHHQPPPPHLSTDFHPPPGPVHLQHPPPPHEHLQPHLHPHPHSHPVALPPGMPPGPHGPMHAGSGPYHHDAPQHQGGQHQHGAPQHQGRQHQQGPQQHAGPALGPASGPHHGPASGPHHGSPHQGPPNHDRPHHAPPPFGLLGLPPPSVPPPLSGPPPEQSTLLRPVVRAAASVRANPSRIPVTFNPPLPAPAIPLPGPSVLHSSSSSAVGPMRSFVSPTSQTNMNINSSSHSNAAAAAAARPKPYDRPATAPARSEPPPPPWQARVGTTQSAHAPVSSSASRPRTSFPFLSASAISPASVAALVRASLSAPPSSAGATWSAVAPSARPPWAAATPALSVAPAASSASVPAALVANAQSAGPQPYSTPGQNNPWVTHIQQTHAAAAPYPTPPGSASAAQHCAPPAMHSAQHYSYPATTAVPAFAQGWNAYANITTAAQYGMASGPPSQTAGQNTGGQYSNVGGQYGAQYGQAASYGASTTSANPWDSYTAAYNAGLASANGVQDWASYAAAAGGGGSAQDWSAYGYTAQAQPAAAAAAAAPSVATPAVSSAASFATTFPINAAAMWSQAYSASYTAPQTTAAPNANAVAAAAMVAAAAKAAKAGRKGKK